MNNDHTLHHVGASPEVLAHDRRSDVRRTSRASIWLLDEDLTEATELGVVRDISRGGISFTAGADSGLSAGAMVPGREWLVLLDDPSGLEPLADQRAAVLRLLRVDHTPEGHVLFACSFATRRVGQCVRGRHARVERRGDELSDVLAGDMLDELADRVQRDLGATLRADRL